MKAITLQIYWYNLKQVKTGSTRTMLWRTKWPWGRLEIIFSPDCAGLVGYWRWRWGWWLHSGYCCWQTYFFRSQRRCICVCIYPYFGSRTSHYKIKFRRDQTVKRWTQKLTAKPPQSSIFIVTKWKQTFDTSAEHLWKTCTCCLTVSCEGSAAGESW